MFYIKTKLGLAFKELKVQKWGLPTLAQRTTIGLAAFHFRVRNGNGWDNGSIIPTFALIL